MNLASRPWIVAAFLGLLSLSPAHAGMTSEEVKLYEGYKAQAEKGNSVAQYNVGYCYDNGEGVEKDKGQAALWYRKAAEQGLAEAQYNLGLCYAKGEGVTKDFVKAVSWYRKAAEQWYALAQSNLGYCYANGEGVETDKEQAVLWYRKAAEQGNAVAQYNLGLCYINGEGVAKDVIEAYAYWSLAGITAEAARKNLAILEKQMSPDARLLGQQRAKQMQKEIERSKTILNALKRGAGFEK